MNNFLDVLPIIFYFIAGCIAISYQLYLGRYSIQPTKKTNIIALSLVILFGILSIASSIVFWLFI